MKKLFLSLILLFSSVLISTASNAWVVVYQSTTQQGRYQVLKAITEPEHKIFAVYNDFDNAMWVVAPPESWMPIGVQNDIYESIAWANANFQPWRWGRVEWVYINSKGEYLPYLEVCETFNNRRVCDILKY